MKIEYHKELKKILEIVKKNPKGSTIKEISEKIGVNRNAVAKYLDVLQVAGQVEVKKYGPAKVYFPSRSIPISTLFEFSDDFIIIVEKNMTTVEINTPFLNYLELLNKDKVIGKPIKNLPFTKAYQKMTDNIRETLEKQEILEDEFEYRKNSTAKPEHFKIKFIPTTFNDGGSGVVVMLKRV
ncbi:MAG TPA: winged helix-turn-helix transcriptional regulator [Thermoplasmata archaeon]|nr:winged helix-turn-helix transcriptional regulator [Thermoplasmata archaeon]